MKEEISKWQKEADKLGNEMEEYAKKYECKKCNEFYCIHMLRTRARKYKRHMDKELVELFSMAWGI